MRILLTGNGPLENRGCEAIVLGIMQIMESISTKNKISYVLASFANDAPHTLPKGVVPVELKWRRPRFSKAWFDHQIRKFLGLGENLESFLRPLDAVSQVDIACSIGGDGYAIDAGHCIVDRLMKMDLYLKRRGFPVVIWGASIGPFSSEPQFEKAMAAHLRMLDHIIVREPESLEYLHHLGIKENVTLAADPAFAMVPVAVPLPEDIQELLSSRPCIGINISPLAGLFAGVGLDRWVIHVADIIESIAQKTSMGIVLVPHVTSASGDPRMDDGWLLDRARVRLSASLQKNVLSLPRTLRAPQLKWVIGRLHAFIGARTHATIAAISMGVPTLSLGYSRKARGLNRLVFGHEEWLISVDKATKENVTQRLDAILAQHCQIRAHLQKVIPGLVTSALKAGEMVFSLAQGTGE